MASSGTIPHGGLADAVCRGQNNILASFSEAMISLKFGLTFFELPESDLRYDVMQTTVADKIRAGAKHPLEPLAQLADKKDLQFFRKNEESFGVASAQCGVTHGTWCPFCK